MGKILSGKELRDRASELGVSTQEKPDLNVLPAYTVSEATLQHRVREAESHIRQNRLCIISVISAIAAVISAIGSLLSALIPYLHR